MQPGTIMRAQTAKRKNVLIDQSKLTRVQQLLNARTETEAIDKALDQILFCEEVMSSLNDAAGRGKKVKDVFGNLG